MNGLIQHLTLFAAVFFSICLLVACSGNNAINERKDSNAASSSNPASSDSSGDIQSSFSATLDGVKITGNGVDEFQLVNAAFIYPQADNSKRLLFFLKSTKDGSDPKPDYSFRFSIPDKEGVFTKNINDGQPYDITLDFLNGDRSRYWSQAVTVNLTSITTSRIQGTFSGKFILSNDTPRGNKKEVTIADGKFDIPFSTSKITPE
jgi:hypothetical protein